METKNVLVTGGAGFIGSHLVDKLIEQGHNVTILDNLEPQVHNGIPDYLNEKAEFIERDMRDQVQLRSAIKDTEIIFHDASLVGVGQSQYQVRRYMDANVGGTANLMDILVTTDHNVEKLILASSMSLYGEGSYECNPQNYKCERRGIIPLPRTTEQMSAGDWEMHCTNCGIILDPIPTPETKSLEADNVYALSKWCQEQLCMCIGKTYGIPTVALRYFNTYGPRQSLNNPYTGVAAIFLSRIKNNNPPIVFEDGLQSRNFISVHDIVDANMLAMEQKAADYEIFNVGTGKQMTVLDVANILIKLHGSDVKPDIVGKFRKGDTRHCFADISKIKNTLGFEPKISFEDGMRELMDWSHGVVAKDQGDKATKELEDKGLL